MRTDGSVVIALDGAAHSAGTLAWGVAEAVRRRASVVLTQVVDTPWMSSWWGTYPVIDVADAEIEAKGYLSRLQQREGRRHPSLEISVDVRHGPAIPELRDLSTDAQLVVVGAGQPSARGRTGVLGAHLAAHARCPVAVVRHAPDLPTPPEAPIVVGVDGSSASIEAARVAAREAWMRGRTLVLVHARPTVPDPYSTGSVPPLSTHDVDDPTHRAARRVQDSLVRENPGLEVRLELVDDDPATALVGIAREAALLVVGTRGLGSFRGMLLGSVSTDVVRSATCPVLVVHGQG
ncbi:universal stress protein [Cellulomonas sp. URHD0024]|uniref:universal stress protein n=1 Tax=Cellulomonas sp. URHD0024 TaxID=1302620 RepID=UPI0003FA74FC|nr:universal stress protein [Cellulomonas sp. URHD0024]